MKINVEGIMPTMQAKIIEVVEAIPEPGFAHVPNGSPIRTTVVFETGCEDEELCCDLVKKTIKDSEVGRMMSFRVIRSGKLY